MGQYLRIFCFVALFCVHSSLSGTIRYVDASNGAPMSPFDSPATAAATIQAAVNVADSGDVVMVAPGVYATGSSVTPGFDALNRVVIDKAVTVESTDGASMTIIEGAADSASTGPYGTGAAAVRGVYLSNGARLKGFTIRGGHTMSYRSSLSLQNLSGGGVFIDGSGELIDSMVSHNVAEGRGGGVFLNSGGRVSGSTITSNIAVSGGGVFLHRGGIVSECIVESNTVDPDYSGGGIAMMDGGRVLKTTIRGNGANRPDRASFTYYDTLSHGGGVYIAYGGTVEDSRIENHTTSLQGAGAYLLEGGVLRNTVIAGNTSTDLAGSGFTGGGSYSAGAGVVLYQGGSLIHCTIAGNTAGGSGFGGGLRVKDEGLVVNSIIYSNTASNAENWHFSDPALVSAESLSTAPVSGLPGSNHLGGDPLFHDLVLRDFSLQKHSPCVDSGAVTGVESDIDGVPRGLDGNNDGVSGPDVGAFERVDPLADSDGDQMRDAWEISNGLDALLDDALLDPDHDGVLNLNEWRWDSNPLVRNPALEVLMPRPEDPIWGVQVSTSSLRNYTLYRSETLEPGDWFPVSGATLIPGNDGLLSLTDSAVNGSFPVFWKVEAFLQ